jgi:hypothetical protein
MGTWSKDQIMIFCLEKKKNKEKKKKKREMWMITKLTVRGYWLFGDP